MDIIKKYFPDLTDDQVHKLEQLQDLYIEWNEKINVVSRKDIEALYERHVLHSLGIYKVMRFSRGTKILDVGTGGGFPGIPLAIMNPDSQFLLIDSIGKKIKVVNGVVESLGLTNVRGEQLRVQQVKDKYDFIVSRAVTAFPKFVNMSRKTVKPGGKNSLANGILYLKGGDFEEELKGFRDVSVFPLTEYFEESFFETKKVIHLSL
ncbi:16S rRNA (guanine(527)-N(7))-methyltransferase RsmG [Puteibacter caeruleilacunae]|nr:16S rRNA (guanine(527)-N(7))-methyltransferase RsmG [Puteibacter caeruleilacunae]